MRYLLANPACELLGITTVTGNTVARASLASVLCKIAGKKVPIFPGKRESLLTDQKQPTSPQESALPRWDHDTRFPENEAIDFLRRTICANPGEVVLLGIGPMSNLAALFAVDEEIPQLLKGLVLMCGNFLSCQPHAEWNALVDPVATAITYRAQPPSHRSIGLDVTTQVVMQAPEVRKRFEAPLLRPVLDFAEVFFKHAPFITFHDPLAAATIFDDTICGFERGRVDIELKSDHTPGATIWHPKAEGGRHEIATTVQKDRFFDHYFGFFQ
jgi:inosine-uridine nucleoside N-ribohydrolase